MIISFIVFLKLAFASKEKETIGHCMEGGIKTSMSGPYIA